MIKGILMDKDGTLVYFAKDWVYMVRNFILKFTDDTKAETILAEIGYRNGTLLSDGLLSSASTKEFVTIIANFLDYDTEKLLKSFQYYQLVCLKEEKLSLEPVPNLVETLRKLKEQSIILGIATADDYESTLYTLKKLGIDSYIDFVGTSDRFLAKPNKEMLSEFCIQHKLRHDEVIHIGDTSVDMEFAQNCLAGIGVLSGNGTEQELKSYTNYIINSLDEVTDYLPTILCSVTNT
ncbi:MAG: HAD family hydrolase [Enterococcus faecalis]|nr:HAD family hydrolase [Enterococcus faecalis]